LNGKDLVMSEAATDGFPPSIAFVGELFRLPPNELPR